MSERKAVTSERLDTLRRIYTDRSSDKFVSSEVWIALELIEEIDRLKTHLEQLPCDSDKANDWLNHNAPRWVLSDLWSWRHIAQNGLQKHKDRIAELEDQVAVKKGESQP